MKYIKSFEDIELDPDVGDYVVVKVDLSKIGGYSKIAELLESQIGEITERAYFYPSFTYKIKFGTTYWSFSRKEIVAFSKNKEDLDYLVKAKKYNL